MSDHSPLTSPALRPGGSEAERLAVRCAQTMLGSDRATRDLGMQLVEVGPGRARLNMRIRDDMVNGHDVAHGGFIFTLADSAFAFACNTYDVVTVAQGASIEFVRSARRGNLLQAEAIERSRGRNTGVYDVTVTDEDDRIIACFRGKSFSLGRPILGSEPAPGTPAVDRT
ncbi:MAG: hydroxyphenylacetyl-CoA thioesterase PaaI [Gammaproteobacteria bacterium]|nr:hydroxyphenylacetyl-CoA thioesterase PaaI [Gammaproteobacteria bacterium]